MPHRQPNCQYLRLWPLGPKVRLKENSQSKTVVLVDTSTSSGSVDNLSDTCNINGSALVASRAGFCCCCCWLPKKQEGGRPAPLLCHDSVVSAALAACPAVCDWQADTTARDMPIPSALSVDVHFQQVACRRGGPLRWTRGTTRRTFTIPPRASAPGSVPRLQRRCCRPAGQRAPTRALASHTITTPAPVSGSGSGLEVRLCMGCDAALLPAAALGK